MENHVDKAHPLNDLMRSTMDKIREMVDTNTIVGQPITTADGVTLIPISKAFLVVKDGTTRVLPVSMPPASTADRVVEMVPDILDKVEKYFDKKQEKEDF